MSKYNFGPFYEDEATADDAEELTDEELEDVAGGWSGNDPGGGGGSGSGNGGG